MKRLSICSSLACLTFLIAGFAPERSMAQAGDVVVHAATVDLTHNPGTEPVDQIDMTASFTNNEFKELRKCEPAESLIQQGVRVGIQPGLCGSASRTNKITIPFFRPLAMGSNVAVYEGLTAEKATADAVLRTLRRVPGTCGSYSLRLDAINVNLANVKSNPVAVIITLPDGSSGCLAINNALIDQ